MASDLVSQVFGQVLKRDGKLYEVKWVELHHSAGTAALITAVAGKKLTVVGIDFTFDAAGTVGFNSAATVKRHPQSFATNGGLQATYVPWGWFVQTAAGEALNIVVTNGPINGAVLYIELD